MRFQLVLTTFFKSKLFSCLPKVDHVTTVMQRAYYASLFLMKLVKLPVNDTNTASCQTNTSPTNNKNELWKAVRLTSCQKPQLQLVSNFFKFVHLCFLLYLLCFIYLFVMFWAVSFLNLKVSLSLMAVPTVRNFVNGFVTQRRSQLKPTTMKHQTVKLFDLLNMLSGKMQKQKSILPFPSLQFFSNCSKYLLTFLRMIILYTWMQ